MRAPLHRAATVLGAAVTGYVGAAVLLTLAVPVLGWSSSVVVSGSMSPAVEVGDVVLAAPQPQEQLQAGDVVVLQTGTGRLTHRLVGVTAAGWQTQGDANPTPDSDPARPEQVLGRVVVVVPAVGLPAVWARAGWHHLAP